MSPERTIATVLVANRGEIARRVLRAARELGLRSVAVHGTADRDAVFTREADCAVSIGDERDGLPYLDADAILAAAQQTGADAIHPGYGFLAENAEFAERVLAAGLVWIGPPPAVMRAMGDKDAAKSRARALGVPVVPGVEGRRDDGTLLTHAELAAAAVRDVGFPCLVKAAAGGGGRGMRRVDHADALLPALDAAALEAERNFGDGTLLVERYVGRGRHVEVQVLADRHGNVVHLFERDCSMQRRHQKLIEEAPAPFLPAHVRAALAADAVELTRALAYESAGTVEFLVDAATLEHHFLEVNARVQVEHPVTELITGIDIVQTQILIAMGLPLPFTQDAVRQSGFAVEARICVEDPRAGFAPQAGDVARFSVREQAGLRVDAALEPSRADGSGSIPVHYDSMVGKLIAHGPTRAVAIARLARALEGTCLFGVTNNRTWLIAALRHPDFAAGRVTTRWVDDGDGADLLGPAPRLADVPDVVLAVAALGRHHAALQRRFRSNPSRADVTVFEAPDGELAHVHLVADRRPAHYRFAVEHGADAMLHVVPQAEAVVELVEVAPDRIFFRFDGHLQSVWHLDEGDDAHIWLQWSGAGGATFDAVALRERSLLPEPGAAAPPAGAVVAPSSAVVVRVHVAEGDRVKRGDTLVTVEAMKMLTPLVAGADGVVAAVLVSAGESVVAGATLVEVEASGDPGEAEG
ncbi:MAG: biotin/lipoyl-binding protein [Deltaproteobacteria bacterium]|nr:biotin/lipoyl-binding protein [Deltaproteobacteria bacterium]